MVETDTAKSHPARMYDWYPGGTDRARGARPQAGAAPPLRAPQAGHPGGSTPHSASSAAVYACSEGVA